jgi:hypothetical protein
MHMPLTGGVVRCCLKRQEALSREPAPEELAAMRNLVREMAAANKALLSAAGRCAVDDHEEPPPVASGSSHGYMLAMEEGLGNVVATVYPTEEEAREVARATWMSYVLYDLAVPWEPREIGDGGLGFGHDTIRAEIAERHRLVSAPRQSRASVGAPEYEVG